MELWAQPLRRQLFVALVLMLVPMISAAVWLAMEEYRAIRAELADQTRVTALRTAAAVERELMGFDRMAVNLSSNPVVSSLDARAVEPLLRSQLLQRTSLVDLVLLDRAGRLVARGNPSSDVPAEWTHVVSAVLRSDSRVVSPLEAGPAGRPFVVISYPVRDDTAATVGVLVCYVDPGLLPDAFAQLRLLLPEQSVVMLTEMDGRVLVRTLDPDTHVGTVMGANWFADAPAPPQEYPGVDGVRRMVAQSIVEGGPWVVSVGIPMSVAWDRALSLWTRSVAVLVLGLGSWLLIALVFSRRLTRSVAHLEATAQRIASGDFAPLERRPMPTAEFSALQNAFGHMLSRLNEARAALDRQMAEERQMRQEVESLQRQVIRQERLAAVGQLVSGVAHEINNPLQAILGFSELLQMQSEVPDSMKGDLVLIQKESARACGIIRSLALFARQQSGDAEPIRLGDVVRSVVEFRQRRLETEGVELRVEDSSQRHVMAVLAELQQVVLNFVINAEQAIVASGRQPGRITVRTRDRGDRVILEVEDTGPGVAPEHEARLFQPFFTTKPVGQGTGLGLSVSYGIIDSLGGSIGYRSAPAGGAVFHFDLPAATS